MVEYLLEDFVLYTLFRLKSLLNLNSRIILI
jgi:hypothetical protein